MKYFIQEEKEILLNSLEYYSTEFCLCKMTQEMNFGRPFSFVTFHLLSEKWIIL